MMRSFLAEVSTDFTQITKERLDLIIISHYNNGDKRIEWANYYWKHTTHKKLLQVI